MALIIFILCAAYLIGSIPVGYLLMKNFKKIDIRDFGSGNIGMTNVWRVAGPAWGVTTLLLDISKGVSAVLIPHFLIPGSDPLEVMAGFFVLLGNVFPVFLKFKGGKGVGVSIGVFFTLLPPESAVATLFFAAAVLLTRMVSAGSLLAVSALAILTLYHQKGITWLSALTLVAAAMVWWTHRKNIQRVLNGTENKIGKKTDKGTKEKA